MAGNGGYGAHTPGTVWFGCFLKENEGLLMTRLEPIAIAPNSNWHPTSMGGSTEGGIAQIPFVWASWAARVADVSRPLLGSQPRSHI